MTSASASASASAAPGQLTVVVVTGSLFDDYMSLWRACERSGVSIVVVGNTELSFGLPWRRTPVPPTGVPYISLRPFALRGQRGPLWWWYRGLFRTIRRLQPDVIHVLSEPWGLLAVQSTLAQRLVSRRSRLSVHGADNVYHHGRRTERFVRRWILKWVFGSLHGFASWNREGVDVARDSGLTRRVPTVVVPAVVPDPDRFSALPNEGEETRKRFGVSDAQVIVGFIGRFSPEKGILELIEAIGLLGSAAPFLCVWGDGELRPEIERAISDAGIRGRLMGPLAPSDVAAALRSCDIVAIPSRNLSHLKEQFSRLAVEAMLTATPIVGFSTGELSNVVGSGGVLVRDGDVAALADAISGLSGDRRARERMGLAGRESVLERFHPQALAARLVAFWQSLV